MTRLSLWKDGQRTNDYRFIDRTISEYFQVGGTGILVHKYLGPKDTGPSDDVTQPQYINQSAMNIQDLLFLENRDRKYDTAVYIIRGMYQVTDNAFDLTQFGLFLQTGTLFMTFHINDMLEILGRRIMNGDVIELQHLIDYDTLDESIPVALKRFFVVSDCTRAAEGYSPTWWPHLWRCKINPLVDAQEYRDILNTITINDESTTPIRDILSTFDKYTEINDVIIKQAESEAPKSGYDTAPIYHFSSNAVTPTYSTKAYLGGDGTAPNGLPATQGTSFPMNATEGQYCLRIDYKPNRLFRFNGARWIKIEDNVRTSFTTNSLDNLSMKNQFKNNSNTFTDVRGNTQPEKQSLHNLLKPKADN